jgi:3-hydroxyisobutyrate dehydrogenase-like beta-hydroxyacid dehydrogenase
MTASSRQRIGFLGLGIMGSRMAANLAAGGFPLAVWTHSPGKAQRWADAHGASARPTPAEVTAESDVVITMVVDGEQVESVLLGRDGAATSGRDGLLAIDMSTIGPAAARRIAAGLASRGIAFLDAPVTGSSPRAEDGTLTIMAGGERADFERALPALEAMGSLVEHVGPTGQGQMVKLLNNSLAAANAAALAEALVLAAATGVDLDALERIVGAGSGASAQLQAKARPMRDHDFTTLFKTAHLLKDVRLCLQEAEDAGVPFPAAGHARALLAASVGRGRAEEDYAAIVEAAEGLAGRRIQG